MSVLPIGMRLLHFGFENHNHTKTMKHYIATALLLICISGDVLSQDRCGTVEYIKSLEQKVLREGEPVFEKWLSQKITDRRARMDTRATYTIPVVVHVIHKGEAYGVGSNISDEQIRSQIKVLNKDFKRLNSDTTNTPADFIPLAGKVNIEFVLARQTPAGLATNGIVRVNGSRSVWTINQDTQLKAVSYWPAEDYLNLWVTDLENGLLGYAQFPVSSLSGLNGAEDNRSVDGVVVDYMAFGSIDDGAFNLYTGFSKGRAATHELGHFFGLRHIWGDDDGRCGGSGDYVSDTPDAGDKTSGCPTHPYASCVAKTMFQNYMDYTNDNCMNLYTLGQASRIETVLASSPRRASLLTSHGLLDPSELTDDLALISILKPSAVQCENIVGPVLQVANKGISTINKFKVNYTLNSGTEATKSFEGLAIAPGANLEITMPFISLMNGENLISFRIIEPNGFPDINTANNSSSTYTVLNSSSDIIPLRQSFDGIWESAWTAVNPAGGMNWTERSTNYDRSICFQSFSNITTGDKSLLVSPVLDLSSTSYASMFFDLSYRFKAGADDGLKIVASRDCGATYNEILFDAWGSSLSGKTTSSSWTPSQPADWERKYINLTQFAGEKNVRIGFVATNGHGNNMFIDNMEFFVSDSQDPAVPLDLYSVYRSQESSNELFIAFNLISRQPVNVDILNILGQPVLSTKFDDVLNQTVMLEPGEQSAGVYIVRMSMEGGVYSERVMLGRQ
jgi:Pregnancy-associated plasma protein-A